jgi:hypothetical protein
MGGGLGGVISALALTLAGAGRMNQSIASFSGLSEVAGKGEGEKEQGQEEEQKR